MNHILILFIIGTLMLLAGIYTLKNKSNLDNVVDNILPKTLCGKETAKKLTRYAYAPMWIVFGVILICLSIIYFIWI